VIVYLLDTNALSEPLKKVPSASFLRRLEESRGQAKATSSICVMELRSGCARHAQGGRLWQRIQAEILGHVDVLSVDGVVAERAGELMAEVRKRGRPRSTEDLLIAATCLAHRLSLVTHNRSDFIDIPGLRVEDWM